MSNNKLKEEYKPYETIGASASNRVDALVQDVYGSKHHRRPKVTVYDEIKRITSLSWKHIGFTFYIIPKATPRPRSSRLPNGRMIFYVKGAGDHKQFLKEYLKNEDIQVIESAIKFDCKTYLPIPKGMPATTKVCAELGLVRPVVKPDWDNLAKTYCDMIQGLIIKDDRLIIDGRLRKFYSVKPRVEIDLYYLHGFDSEYNRRKILNI